MAVKSLLLYFTTTSRPFTLLPGMCLVILCTTRMENRNRLTGLLGREALYTLIHMHAYSQPGPRCAHPLALIGHQPIAVGAGVVQLADSSVVMTGAPLSLLLRSLCPPSTPRISQPNSTDLLVQGRWKRPEG